MDKHVSRQNSGEVSLREVQEEDLAVFFEHQLDPAANEMAAFAAKNPGDQDAFEVRWNSILSDGNVGAYTITFDGQVAGHLLSFIQFGKPAVAYWLGREFWGKGIATRALELLLLKLKTRPLYARAAKDNVGSLRVLQKCGFTIIGEDTGYSHPRGQDVEEYILVLETSDPQ